MKRIILLNIIGLYLGLLIAGCGGLISVDLPPQSSINTEEEWLMLGRNPERQHYSIKNITPPLGVVWDKNVKSVVADHPLAIGDVILAPTVSGMLYMVDYKTGEGMGSGRLGPALSSVPTIDNHTLYAGLNLGDETLVGIDLRKIDKLLQRNYPQITTSPLITDDKIFFGTNDNLFFCVNQHSGDEIWKYKTNARIHSSPALKHSAVIFGDDKGWVYALEATSGIKLWARQLEGSIFSHPVLDDSIAYIGTVTGKMFGLDINSGKVVWSRAFDGAIYGSPSLYRNILYFGNNAHQVIALHKHTGEVIWKFETKGIVNTVPLPSPDYVYVTSWDKNLYVLNRFSGKLIFKYELDHAAKSSPIIYRDYLIVHTANDELIALANEKLIQARRDKK